MQKPHFVLLYSMSKLIDATSPFIYKNSKQ